MNAKTVILNETKRLAQFSNEAKAEIRILFEFVTGKDAVVSMLEESDISDCEVQTIKNAVDRLLKGEPIQYVMGTWSFMGNDFIVTPDVLIPRADTEILCESVIRYINEKNIVTRVLDLCSGSGCIGISIAKSCEKAYVDCTDISLSAVEIIKKNAQQNGILKRVNAFCSHMFEKCATYDIIASNPPYIPSADIDTLDDKVRLFEPRIALDGGSDGLDFYRIIAKNARKHLSDDGILFMEIGFDERLAVTDIFKAHGYSDITCIKDYSGNDRVITCRV